MYVSLLYSSFRVWFCWCNGEIRILKNTLSDLGMTFGRQQVDIPHSSDTQDCYSRWHRCADNRHCRVHKGLTLSSSTTTETGLNTFQQWGVQAWLKSNQNYSMQLITQWRLQATMAHYSDWPTDHATRSVTIGRFYVRSTAMRFSNNKISLAQFGAVIKAKSRQKTTRRCVLEMISRV